MSKQKWLMVDRSRKAVRLTHFRDGMCAVKSAVDTPGWNEQVRNDWLEGLNLLKEAGLFVEDGWAVNGDGWSGPKDWCFWCGPVESVVGVLRMNGFEVVMVYESVFRF